MSEITLALPDAKIILIVEDDPAIRGCLRTLFEGEGYSVHHASNGLSALAIFDAHPIDIVLLDLGLGSENGLEVLRGVRERRDVPVILVTAKSGNVDRIVGLELGADDYIVKPFFLREVLARVRAVLRRSPRKAVDFKSDRQLIFCDMTLDIPGRELRKCSGDHIALTGAEFELLASFVENAGRVMSREQLLNRSKGSNSEALDRAVDTLVSRIRRKIEVDPDLPLIIKTVRGVGYVFSAAVSRCYVPPAIGQ